MIYPSPATRPLRLPQVLLSLLLALAVALAVFPARASAATVTCTAYYTIQKDDTTSKIAKTFNLKWKQIAVANKMTYPYKLTPGKVLCIPPKDFSVDPSTSPGAVLKVTTVNNRLTVTVSNTTARRSYYVRVREVSNSVGGWYKLGSLRVPKNTVVIHNYNLPSKLSGAIYLEVCLKDATTDERICRTVLRSYN